jgi:hypothetical protein
MGLLGNGAEARLLFDENKGRSLIFDIKIEKQGFDIFSYLWYIKIMEQPGQAGTKKD